ncbi:MAG: hypothetical protein ABMA26_15835 [Limisphaerales bacterium]
MKNTACHLPANEADDHERRQLATMQTISLLSSLGALRVASALFLSARQRDAADGARPVRPRAPQRAADLAHPTLLPA